MASLETLLGLVRILGGLRICTTVNEDYKLEVFSRAKYLAIVDDAGNAFELLPNPALNSPTKRPRVAKECVSLGADVVIAPRGSLCYPSYKILKKANVKTYVANPGTDLSSIDLNQLRAPDWREVLGSSIQAVKERLFGH
ncbi:MAG: NifB/NifX family molybdenum-iron cluster-binding protein [Thermoprotei archaeon]